ncbi:glycosyl transferase family 2 [Prevotella sp. TCVGH]|uniref:glycosyltransferase family 2 protein n=1 Tax=Prevotella sp. TCVGH TaxID=2182433 RepID=UPI00201E6AB5|nr:glycosyltransferase family 2 protein [Prevotella sp. TCVGH]MCL6747661.1 glycosyl transferase family 2 [Prevotella sp. TCVGH]
MQLSIIIPVYLAEETLQRCVKSILQQTFTNWELILVDDGSPDGCPALCDEYCQQDARIKVVHQVNGGLSAARNSGLLQAQGSYVTFVDSDDYVRKDTYQQVMQQLVEKPEIDIIEYPITLHAGNKQREKILSFPVKSYNNMLTYWFESKAYLHTYAWNKVYKRRLFNQVRYPANKVFEDVYTLPLLLRQSKVVATTDKGMYFYVDNPQGITATAGGEQLKDLLHAHLAVLQDSQLTEHEGFANYYEHILNIQMDVCEMTGAQPTLPSFNFRGQQGIPFKTRLSSLIGIQRLCQLNQFIHKVYRRSR